MDCCDWCWSSLSILSLTAGLLLVSRQSGVCVCVSTSCLRGAARYGTCSRKYVIMTVSVSTSLLVQVTMYRLRPGQQTTRDERPHTHLKALWLTTRSQRGHSMLLKLDYSFFWILVHKEESRFYGLLPWRQRALQFSFFFFFFPLSPFLKSNKIENVISDGIKVVTMSKVCNCFKIRCHIEQNAKKPKVHGYIVQ